jgi:hypothetical protein
MRVRRQRQTKGLAVTGCNEHRGELPGSAWLTAGGGDGNTRPADLPRASLTPLDARSTPDASAPTRSLCGCSFLAGVNAASRAALSRGQQVGRRRRAAGSELLAQVNIATAAGARIDRLARAWGVTGRQHADAVVIYRATSSHRARGAATPRLSRSAAPSSAVCRQCPDRGMDR